MVNEHSCHDAADCGAVHRAFQHVATPGCRLQVRTLQRRLYELGYGPDGLGEGPAAGGGGEEEEDGDVCLEADLHRLLAHSRKVEDEMKHYGQVWWTRAPGNGGCMRPQPCAWWTGVSLQHLPGACTVLLPLLGQAQTPAASCCLPPCAFCFLPPATCRRPRSFRRR